MNLDDIDFEEEWKKFKSKINKSGIEAERFWIKDHDNGTISICIGHVSVFNMDLRVMNILKQLKLVVDDTTIGAVGFYRINPEAFQMTVTNSQNLQKYTKRKPTMSENPKLSLNSGYEHFGLTATFSGAESAVSGTLDWDEILELLRNNVPLADDERITAVEITSKGLTYSTAKHNES